MTVSHCRSDCALACIIDLQIIYPNAQSQFDDPEYYTNDCIGDQRVIKIVEKQDSAILRFTLTYELGHAAFTAEQLNRAYQEIAEDEIRVTTLFH